MATILRYAIFFFYVLVFAASAKNVTIEPGKTPGEALGSLQEVPNFSWKHIASGKVFKASAYTEQAVWGTMPAGEYELTQVGVIEVSDNTNSDSNVKKTVTATTTAAVTTRAAVTATAKTEVTTIPNNNQLLRESLSLNTGTDSALAIPRQRGMEDIPPVVVTLKEIDERILGMRAMFQAMDRMDPNNSEQENPERTKLRKEIVRLSIERDNIYAKSMALRTQVSEDETSRINDPYFEVMKIFDKEIKGKLVARMGTSDGIVQTRRDLVDFYISTNCSMGGVIQIASVRFDCATIGRTNQREKQANNSIFPTEVEIKAKKQERLDKLKNVVLQLIGLLTLTGMLVGGIFLFLRKRETARQNKTVNASYSTLSTGTPPAAARQHQLAAPTGPSATQQFRIPSNATAAFAARPTQSSRYSNKPVGPTLVIEEDTVDEQDLELTVSTAQAADTDSIYGWRLMQNAIPFMLMNANVKCQTTVLPNGILVEVHPMAAGNAVTAINNLIASSRKPLRLHGVGITGGMDNYFILPDTSRYPCPRHAHRTARHTTTAMA